jgi:CheY-like chemotaxis protein
MNLVVNAVRYTQRGAILIACRRRGDRALIEIRDSGVGIPVASQQEIFREFVQLDNPERGRAKGLGLGLAICARIATLLGHRLGVRSAPGRGSLFWLELPLARPQDAPDRPAEAPPMPGAQLAGVAVALVDDDAAARTATCSLLESWGCQVIAAASAAQLLRDCGQSTVAPRIAICDFRLPDGESGFTVARALRQRYSATLPVILISGDTDADLMRRSAEAQLPLLHKPVRPAKLRALLNRLLGGAG